MISSLNKMDLERVRRGLNAAHRVREVISYEVLPGENEEGDE